ncbi:MAG: hypothetical protein ACTTI6_05870 [Treponema sp.]|uniref:hypothetical protein n=1 Tax=Treponema sp. TaxID=166 RepID=UPI003FA2BFE3
MKKNIGMLALIMCGICLIPACTNPPIFAAIEQEVKLKNASIKSFVYKMVRLENTLFAANGALFKKELGDIRKWEPIREVDDYGRCIGLAEDDANLYGLFGDNGSFKVYKADKNGANWPAVPCMDSADFLAGTKIVFAADTGSKKMYVLSGASAGTNWSLPDKVIPVGAAGVYCLLGNGLYTEAGALVNESPTTDLKGICEGPGNAVFVLDAANLYCYTGSVWSKIPHKVESPQSITYLPRKQLVLIGGKNGYGEIKLKEGADLAKAERVSAGAEGSSIPQKNYDQYQNSVGKWLLNPIMAFDYENTDKNGYIIYAGALDPNATYSGLWGFYYDNQIEWNRE